MLEPVALDALASVLDLSPHELIAVTGGGGKTTVLFALGRQLAGRVVLTTTTKMSVDRTDGFPLLLQPSDRELTDALGRHRSVLVWDGTDQPGTPRKAIGVAPETCDRWFELEGPLDHAVDPAVDVTVDQAGDVTGDRAVVLAGDLARRHAVDHVVVEADGSRRLPCKAPGPFEPVLPSQTTTVITCVGASAFGRVIADRCHRPLRVAALAGCSPYERLTPKRLARVLVSDRGGRKSVPADARFVVLLNQVSASDRPFADEVADEVSNRIAAEAVGDVAEHAASAGDVRRGGFVVAVEPSIPT